MNLGGIYKDIGKLDQALSSTLKSLELNPNSPNAYMNLGGIYKDLGKLDLALSSILKSLELDPMNSIALKQIKFIAGEVCLSLSNANDLLRAYELLLNQTDVSSTFTQYMTFPRARKASCKEQHFL